VDLDSRVISIPPGGGPNKRPRQIPISAQLLAELQQIQQHVQSPYVCRLDQDDRPASPYTFHEHWQAWRDDIGLPQDVTPYALRRTFVQDLWDSGASLEDAVAIAGHSYHVAKRHYAEMQRAGRTDLVDAAGPEPASPEVKAQHLADQIQRLRAELKQVLQELPPKERARFKDA
jgi:integrase